MARNVVEYKPNRGLNIVANRTQLGPGQVYRADNLYFTKTGAQRRYGKRCAYEPALFGAGIPFGITLLKRFYKLATTGTITKYLIKAFVTVIYRTSSAVASSEYSDDARTKIATAKWAQILVPNNANDTLYSGYSSVTASFSSGYMNHAVAAKSWLYMYPDNDSADDDDKTLNAPLRTDGENAFLHGLVPPVALLTADTQNSPTATSVVFDPAIPLPAGGAFVFKAARGPDGKLHALYSTAQASGELRHAVFDGTSWTSDVVVAVLNDLAGPLCGMAVDVNNTIHVVYTTPTVTTRDLVYAVKPQGATTWSSEVVNSAVDWADCAIATTSTGAPQIAAMENVTSFMRFYYNNAGTWTQETIDAAATSSQCDIVVDASDVPHVAYRRVSTSDLRYANRTGGTWSVIEAVETAGDSGNCPSIALDSSGVPSIVHYVVGTGIRYAKRTAGTWSVLQTVEAAVILPIQQRLSHVYENDGFVVTAYYNSLTKSVRYATNRSGAWTITNIAGAIAGVTLQLVVDEDGHVVIVGPTYSIRARRSGYGYILTAEYDDGILGESGPSAALIVYLDNDIDSGHSHTIQLDAPPSGGDKYDMTGDVTKIHIYRTIKGGTATSIFYRVGSQACDANGNPTTDFVDNVSDEDLVFDAKILDTDVFLPPKYRCAAYWKDRLVIGNTKCRNTATTAGSQDSLDLGDTANASIHKNRLRFSEAFAPDQFRQNFLQDIVPDGNSGSIVALVVNPSIDALFVFMENDTVAITDPIGDRVTALSFRPSNIANSHGTPAPDSVVEHMGFLFYWTKQGVEVIAGYSSRNITQDTIGCLWNMQDALDPRYVDRVNPGMFGKVEGTVIVDNRGERIVWSYASATATVNDKELVLHFSRWKDQGFQGDGVWSINSDTNRTISRYCRWDGEGDRGQVFGGEMTASTSVGPWVYRMDMGDEEEHGTVVAAVATVAPAAIAPFRCFPGLHYGGSNERLKRWICGRIDGKIVTKSPGGTSAVLIAVNVDDAALTATLDTVTWTAGTLEHVSKNLPRTAIGMTCGLQVTATDTLASNLGPSPFELYNLSMTLDDLPARTVRG